MITKTGRIVRVEPELEREIGNDPELQTCNGRRRLAKKLFRWAKQLYRTSDVIERDNFRADMANIIELPRGKNALREFCRTE